MVGGAVPQYTGGLGSSCNEGERLGYIHFYVVSRDFFCYNSPGYSRYTVNSKIRQQQNHSIWAHIQV